MPPEIIVFYRVMAFWFPVDDNLRGQPQFVAATPHESIAGHHPSHEKTMLLKALNAIFRA
jgi:hypothetical protein